MNAAPNIEQEEPGSALWLVMLWLFTIAVALGGMTFLDRRALLSELTTESTQLHGLASQRADQHDAHLTALSALALAGEGRRTDLFLDVAATIMRFYPRIKGIYLVPLEGADGSISAGADIGPRRAEIAAAAKSSTGKPVLLPANEGTSAYVMVKRSPNNDAARYGLALLIDTQALMATDAKYWKAAGITRQLRLPGLGGQGAAEPGPIEPQYSRVLSSATQPLRLDTAIDAGFSAYVRPWRMALASGLITGLFLLGGASWRQSVRTRQAEQRAALSDHETRLSHAARVNALGEMASGMAHELTQPLTAILAEAQAARRLIGRGDGSGAQPVLDDIISQTHRASGILERLRNWTRPHGLAAERIDLRESAKNVRALLAHNPIAEGAKLEFDMPAKAIPVVADSVEMEQVLFNLVKNALEATGEGEAHRQVAVSMKTEADQAIVTVTDTGPGIDAEVRGRLFTPFVTTREGGTGLGLALSQRLVERAGGEVNLVASNKGACFRVTLPLALDLSEAAE